MSIQKPKKTTLTVVIVGDFNPKIFQPAWFASQNLIRDKEAEDCTINLVHEEVVNFSIDWCRFEVTRDKFVVATTQESFFEPLRDLILGTFKILSHTPMTMLGINIESHYGIKSKDKWHEFGHRLVPKEVFWDKELTNPGTIQTVVQGERPEGLKGYLRVGVEPSREANPGLYFKINDHFQLQDPESANGCSDIMDIFEKQWTESLARSKRIILSALEAV